MCIRDRRKNVTEYEDTNVTTISELLHSSLTVTDIPAKEIQNNDYCVHVKLPKSFDVLNDELISGKLEDTGNYDTCGSYQLLKGLSLIHILNMVTWPSGKARVCKTLIHQFKSGRHLQKIPGS